MKLVVSSEVVLNGGAVNTKLPQPTTREGFYRDIAVLAYPALESELVDAEAKPVVTASDPEFDVQLATDGRADEFSILHASEKITGMDPLPKPSS